MAYTDYKVNLQLTSGSAGLTLSGTASYRGANFAPGYVPHIIRAVAIAVNTAVTSGATVKFIKGAIGLTGSLTTIASVALTTGRATKGKVVYRENLAVEVQPGQELRVKLTDGGVGKVTPIIWAEPRWEVPLNNTSMITG